MTNNYASFFVALTTGILYGFSMTITSGILLESPWSEQSEDMQGFITTALLIGATIGTFFGGFISDRIGPKKILGASCCISLVCSIGLAIQLEKLALLLVLRAISGLGIGVLTAIGPLYIGEQANENYKGMLGSLFQLFVCVGQLLAYFLNYVFHFDTNGAWRFEFLISGGLFATIFLIGCIFIPESAGYLGVQGSTGTDVTARVNINADVGGSNPGSSSSSQEQRPRSIVNDIRGVVTAALSSKRAFLIGLVLAVLQQMTGINAFMFYSPSIFESFGWTDYSMKIVGSLIVGGWSVVVVIIAFFLVDILGRKPLLIAGWCLMTVGCVLITLNGFVPSLPVLPLGLPGLLVFLFGFQIGPGPVFFVIVSELYDAAVRGRAMGLIVAFNWIANIVVSQLFPRLQSVLEKRVFLIFAIMSAVSVLFVVFFVRETKKPSREIDENGEERDELDPESAYLSGDGRVSYSG